jgi:hypothetical protein
MKHPTNNTRYLVVSIFDEGTELSDGLSDGKPRVCIFNDDDDGFKQSYRFGTLAEARKVKKELSDVYGDHYVIVRALDLDRRNRSKVKL